jgi:hypothetical protein
MRVFLYILGTLLFAGLGIAMVYLTSGWIGYKVILWGSAVFVFFGVIIGIGQSAVEGILVTGVFTGTGYFILRTVPGFFPIYSGVLTGGSLFGIIMGIRAGLEEAPRREAEQREIEEERARDEMARRSEEAKWQEYRRKVASLPIPTPKADIKERFKAYLKHLNQVWSQLPQQLFEPNDEDYELINTWLQREFIRIVEVPLGCRISHTYGDYDPDYDDDLPVDGPWPEIPHTRPMEIWVDGNYQFDSLVTVRDDWRYAEPPFDYVLVYDEEDPDTGMWEKYIPLDQAHFELRSASWI